MNKIIFSFILTTLAGLSTMIGTIFIFIKKNEKIILSSLGFAIGVMLSVSIFDLVPEALNLINFKLFPKIILILIFLNIGFIFSMIIDKKIEHNNSLYRVGIISMITLIIHNIPEGIATFITTNKDIKLGISLGIAILLHNIPEGICVSLPIYYSTNSRFKAFLYTFISGISEVVGALIAYLFLSNISNNALGYMFSFIAGIMIYISIFELFKEALKYKNKLIYLFIILGFVIMII